MRTSLLVAILVLTNSAVAFAQSSVPVSEPAGGSLGFMAVAMGAVALSAWRQKKNR